MINYIHQTADLWVLDKPAGLSLLADRSQADNLWQQLKQQPGKPYLVHRLDKGTSGVLLVARTAATQKSLTRAFAQHEVGKHYLAWVVGNFPRGRTYTIDLPLCKGRKSRYRIAGERNNIVQAEQRFTVTQDRPGVEALTRVRCLQHGNGHSLLSICPRHGRTHQIRVHLSWLGHPLCGDHLYGRPAEPKQSAPRLMLHCHRLVVQGQCFTAPVPPTFTSAYPGA